MLKHVSYEERERRYEALKEDILRGDIRRDILTNSSFKFEGKTRAQYYSNARKNLQSDAAHAVMCHNQQLDDLEILRELKKND